MASRRVPKPANICLLSSVSSGFNGTCSSLVTVCSLIALFLFISMVLSMWTLLFCTIVLSGGLIGLFLFFVKVELGVLSLHAFGVLGVLPVLAVLFFSSLSCLLTNPDKTVWFSSKLLRLMNIALSFQSFQAMSCCSYWNMFPKVLLVDCIHLYYHSLTSHIFLFCCSLILQIT